MATFNEFLLSLDPDSGKRGKQFEHFVKWFLKNDPEWSTQVDQVWLWDEYPDSWGRDCGIDLVFKHKNGENWAVQAKCYAATTSITKADVDSFISESNRDGIDKRLLIATTDLIGPNAKQVCDAQDKPVTRFLLSHFEDADIEYPANLDDLPKAKRKEKPKPREHQIEAIDAVALNFKDVDRGQLIMACGTGKTFTTLWIKERLGVESTLVLLPSLGLLSQTLHEWTLAANEEFQVLCVCSDESVGRRGSDEVVHSIADLAFPVTSNAVEIRAFLSGSGKKVIFSTYQSSPLIAEAQSDVAVPAFDLAIADEAHRCAGKVSGDFSTILNGEKIRAKKRLFTTATPRTYSSTVKKAAEDRGVEVVGMDDEAVFGKQLFALNFGEAIKRGLLTDYRVVIIGVDDPTISAWIENRELLKADSEIEMDAESLASQVGLLKAIKDYDLHRLISFHSRVSRAEEFSQDIHKVLCWIDEKHKPSGELKSDFVSGEMPTDKRRRKLAQLKGLNNNQRGLLTNARCLSEGVDVPSLDGVAFIDPRSSQIDIIQAVGRAIRLSDNKKAGTIVLPVFIGNTDNPEQALEEGNFKPIWDVLNALKAHDDVLANELSEIRTELGRKGGGKARFESLSKFNIDLPIGVDDSFGDSLRTLLVEKTSSSWDFWYGMLENYSRIHGHCNIPKDYIPFDKHNLFNWVSRQRFERNILAKEKITKLENLKGWSWNPLEDRWEKGYTELETYFAKHGTTFVPKGYTTDDGYRLAAWVSTQRRKGQDCEPIQKDRLEKFSDWSWDVLDTLWEKGFEHLLEFIKENGHCLPLNKYKSADDYPLGGWVGSQRKNRLKLSRDKVEKLEALKGWKWNAIAASWDLGFDNLKEYIVEYGNSNVPTNYINKDGYKLGGWVKQQRKMRRTMPTERKRMLKNLEGWIWDPLDTKWDDGFEELKIYKERFGNVLVPSEFITESGYKLGDWVKYQRKRKSDLAKERVKKLQSIDGWDWNTLDSLWEIGYQHLLAHIASGGSSRGLGKYKTPDGFELGTWITNQRIRKDKLSVEREEKLNSIADWSWDLQEDKWNQNLYLLKKYVSEHGNCNIPQSYISDETKLGIWVLNLRRSGSNLSEDKVKVLESFNGWTWLKPRRR